MIPVTTASAELLVRGYDPVDGNDPRYDRFADSSQFIGAGLDFSGVGQMPVTLTDTEPPWATMISPHFFLSAAHFFAGGNVTFYDSNSLSGPSNTYSVSGAMQVYSGGQPTDLCVGIIDSGVSEPYYPVLNQSSVAAGQSLLVCGQANPYYPGSAPRDSPTWARD